MHLCAQKLVKYIHDKADINTAWNSGSHPTWSADPVHTSISAPRSKICIYAHKNWSNIFMIKQILTLDAWNSGSHPTWSADLVHTSTSAHTSKICIYAHTNWSNIFMIYQILTLLEINMRHMSYISGLLPHHAEMLELLNVGVSSLILIIENCCPSVCFCVFVKVHLQAKNAFMRTKIGQIYSW